MKCSKCERDVSFWNEIVTVKTKRKDSYLRPIKVDICKECLKTTKIEDL